MNNKIPQIIEEFITPSFIKTILILGVIVFSLIWIRGTINDYVQLSRQNSYTVRPDSIEKQIQQLIEERGYFKGLAVSLQAQIDARQETKAQLINQSKKQIQNYQNQTIDKQIELWNEQFKKFINQ